jgi:hypothetical protein
VEVASRVVLGAAPSLAAQLGRLAEGRVVLFAGLPGTGKSLLTHQLAHLANAAGRAVHLLQWDVARPVFEASQAGRRYPVRDGVTHPLIRKAAGLWARRALARWDRDHPGPEHLLIGETPLIGSRFVELARPEADDAEAALGPPGCRFVIAVPSVDVRRFLEAERARRSASPLHPREREDAPSTVLRQLWHELGRVGRELGLAEPGADYDPSLYRAIYETILRRRTVEIVSLDTVLPTQALSVYDFAVDVAGLVPTGAEADALIAETERRYPNPAALEREVDRWWAV